MDRRNDAMTSSSGSMPPRYEAVVRRGDRETGPVRLPLDEPEQFINDFNKVYHDHKMSVVATPIATPLPDDVRVDDVRVDDATRTALNGLETQPENPKST